MLFSPFVGKSLAELSTNLCGEVDGDDVMLSGDHGLQRGKLLPRPKARMDTYYINHSVFNFAALSLDAPLKARKLKEPELVSAPLATVQRFEQDARILTMIGSFLECCGATSTRLLEEVSLDEGTQQLIKTFLELEHSRR